MTAPGDRGFTLYESLLILTLLGLAGAAGVAAIRSTAVRTARAGVLGAQAAAGLTVLDRLGAGLVSPDADPLTIASGERVFEVRLAPRDSVLEGAIEITVSASGGRTDLVLDAPRVKP
jgi:hypothetical protein